MYRDISAIETPEDDCYYARDNQTLSVYYPDSTTPVVTNTYKLINDNYTLVDRQAVSEFPTGLQCTTVADLQKFPSPYDFVTPFYHFTAIISALAIGYFAYKLIIYPFFRIRK